MATDADGSRRKHHRSPSQDDLDKSSKRHKHRHHRHHRSHRTKIQTDDNIQHAQETLPALPPPPITNDDVEEGEILEEENSSVKLDELRNTPGVHTNNGDCGLTSSDSAIKFENKGSSAKDVRTEIGDELISKDDRKSHANGDSSHGHHKERKKQHRESGSSSRGVQKQHHDGDPPEVNETKLNNWGNSSSSEGGGDKYKTVAGSASRRRNIDEATDRSKLLSREFAGERSRSQTIVEKDLPLKRGWHQERANNESDDERMPRRDWDVNHDIRDLEREKNARYDRSLGVGDRHSSWGPQDREMSLGREQERERSRDRDLRRSRDRERSRDIDQRRSRDRERSRDRDHRRERDQERSRDMDQRRDRDRESREMDQRRDRDRERSRDRVIDSDRRRDKWERSWDREADRDPRREEEQKRLKEKDQRIEKLRERSLDGEVFRDNRRDREVELEERRKKERERSKDEGAARGSERLRDRERERERDKDRYHERDRAKDRDWERRSDRSRDKNRDFKSDMTMSYNSNNDSLDGSRGKRERDEAEQDDFEEKVTLKLAEQEEDLDRIKEESRKRRLAIIEKHRNKQMQQQKETQSANIEKDAKPAQCTVPSLPASNVDLGTLDSRTEGAAYVAKSSFSVGKSPQQDQRLTSERNIGATGLGEGTPKSERSDEKYCDDIFGETPVGVRKVGNGDGLPIVRSGLHDNWDDADGYYGYRFGETLDGRYEIVAAHGKGVFSTVVRAKDLKAGSGEPEEVAIKIIRNNETMHKAGQSEVQILNKLAAEDPENKRHCVRFLSSFKYRNHLCLVFESLHMNLREILKKFGRNIGLKLTAVRAYAKQLFIALKHLKNCHVLHCDIKPDNMLVNEAKNVLKLCDFGNAMFSGKNEVTPYLVSRFYRAPEIILGLAYDHPMDIWSVGCCLYELYTGKVLFPGPTNNDMLRLHMELKGSFPKKMLKKGAFVDQHFDQDLNFHATEEDPVTKTAIKKVIVNMKPKDIGSIISSSGDEDPKMLTNFKDLLDKIFVLDPEKRMTVTQALLHPFITGK
ncbi:Protein kinase superfamily protein [Euphorbia peplus]|nr:Protein kinase superfamily protein [Euphorbia peplus]